ncbi:MULTISPECIES: hypothetical protein [Streptococcus]|uniref:Uncharacterized protein n=1 Tax=Streptococcus viridans TaxID=78535 RepID=A0A3S4PZ86_9STRE|nr:MULTISPECIES: hypothetical protein [Streptococcus]VED66807.1 Uncharacterised protein [Streptococcus viridans]VEE18337.1 Uncharacterised protein [Streptococcus australis]
MAKEKRTYYQSFIRQLGLFFIYVLIGSTLPFLMISKARYEEPSQFTIFLGKKSLYHAKEFEGLIHSYFTVSLILLIILPVFAILIKYLFKRMGHPFLAHLQSWLIFLACSVILTFTLFSLTVQNDFLHLYWGFYFCQAFYWIFILREWWHLSGMVDKRNHPLDDERAEEKEQPAE